MHGFASFIRFGRTSANHNRLVADRTRYSELGFVVDAQIAFAAFTLWASGYGSTKWTWNRSKIRHMKAFRSGREAKEFLVSYIVGNTARERSALGNRAQMLYFTESGWTLPDMMKVSGTLIVNTTNPSTKEKSLHSLQELRDASPRGNQLSNESVRSHSFGSGITEVKHNVMTSLREYFLLLILKAIFCRRLGEHRRWSQNGHNKMTILMS